MTPEPCSVHRHAREIQLLVHILKSLPGLEPRGACLICWSVSVAGARPGCTTVGAQKAFVEGVNDEGVHEVEDWMQGVLR